MLCNLALRNGLNNKMNSNNKIFIAGSLANGACFSMILPLLAPFIRQLGLTELQGGALVSAGALVMAISAIYISRIQIPSATHL